MATTPKFYYGLSSKYSASTHGSGLFICTDVQRVYIKGQQIDGLTTAQISAVAKIDELESKVNSLESIDHTLYKVVSSLPSAPASGDENKIHLVAASITGTRNSYAEYIWAGSQWEQLGELAAEVDLSGYATKDEVEDAATKAANAQSTADSALTKANAAASASDLTAEVARAKAAEQANTDAIAALEESLAWIEVS